MLPGRSHATAHMAKPMRQLVRRRICCGLCVDFRSRRDPDQQLRGSSIVTGNERRREGLPRPGSTGSDRDRQSGVSDVGRVWQ